MMSLARMLANHDDDAPTAPPTPPDVLAHTLLEVFARYSAGNPFKPGDLVTPRKGYDIKAEGAPHVVLDVLEPSRAVPVEYDGSIARYVDMRVICEAKGTIATFFGESFMYEPYLGPVADMGDGST